MTSRWSVLDVRVFFNAAIALIATSIAVYAQRASAPGETKPIYGVVLDRSTGTPVAGAVVFVGSAANPPLTRTELLYPASAALSGRHDGTEKGITSDSQGNFVLDGSLPALSSIFVTAKGYVPGAFGQLWPLGTALTLTPKQNSGQQPIVVRLWKLGGIRGIATYDAGNAAENLQVQAIRLSFPSLASGYLPLIARTDKTGAYEFEDLEPGKYAIGVVPSYVTTPLALERSSDSLSVQETDELRRSLASAPPTGGTSVTDWRVLSRAGLPIVVDGDRVRGYPSVYYSDARSINWARPVSVKAGEIREDVNLTIPLLRAYRVSGRLLAGPTQRVGRMGVRLIPVGSEGSRAATNLAVAETITDSDGRFMLQGIVPGDYYLKAIKGPPPVPALVSVPQVLNKDGRQVLSGSVGSVLEAPDTPKPILWVQDRITVGNNDLIGLQIPLHNGIRVSGRVSFNTSRVEPRLGRMNVSLERVGGERVPGEEAALIRIEVGPGGEFRSNEIGPGSFIVSVSSASGWMLESIDEGGHDVLSEQLELNRTGDYHVSIIITDKVSQIGGRVVAHNGSDAGKYASVFVFPAAEHLWSQPGARATLMRSVESNASSAFTFGRIPPGEYFVVAISEGAFDSDWRDPDNLESLSRIAQRVTLRSGDSKTIELRPMPASLR
jgi:hypothetical protein